MPRKSAFKCYFGCVPLKGRVHHFPQPEYPHLEKFSQWKMVLSKEDKEKGDNYIYNSIRLCDEHFEEFYRTNNGRLTRNAVPTLNIGSSTASLRASDIPSTSCSAEHDKTIDNVEATYGEGPSTSKEIVLCEDHETRAIIRKKDSIRHENKSIFAVKNRYWKEQAQLKLKLLKLRAKCKNLKQEVQQAAKISQSKAFLKAVEKLPETSAIFTAMQLQKTSVKARGRRFTNKEKILCLTIYKQSQKAYKLLQRLFALPSRRTIQNVLNKVTINSGINYVVIEHLKEAVMKLAEEKKLCTLIFDEVALSPGLYYNKTRDEIIGFEDFGCHKTKNIADHALVFMVKGLKGKYKQPICYTFCQSATKSTELKKLIKEVLNAVQSTGLIVIATICDQSSTNMRVIKSLLDETKRNYLAAGKEYKSLAFECNETKIFPIFDPPHLLKGLRNNLITKDLRFIQDGKVKLAKWEHLKLLLEADPGENDLRLVNKLTESHVVNEKIPKMKVKNAAQVFSQRVSATMRYLASKYLCSVYVVGSMDHMFCVCSWLEGCWGRSLIPCVEYRSKDDMLDTARRYPVEVGSMVTCVGDDSLEEWLK